MKKFVNVFFVIGFLACGVLPGNDCKAQSQEMQQLLLNIEKLTQLKGILADMRAGYRIYEKGYSAVSSLSEGNFNLHDLYLNGLLQVNPSVRNYGRAAEIVSLQLNLVSEYKRAFTRFRQSGSFNASELNYMSKVYARLAKESLANVEELVNILTASKLRMSDADRLSSIDRLYADATDRMQFLRYFDRSGALLSIRRAKEHADAEKLIQLYGIKN